MSFTSNIFEPIHVKAIPEKSNGLVLLLELSDNEWFGSSVWENDPENEYGDIYFVQESKEYYIPKKIIKKAYFIKNK